jgi:hypothetical protein
MVLGYLMEASSGLRKHVLNGIEADEPLKKQALHMLPKPMAYP